MPFIVKNIFIDIEYHLDIVMFVYTLSINENKYDCNWRYD